MTTPDTNMFAVWTYLMYLTWSIATTIWVARTLHRNGRVFLVDAFGGNGELADSVNHLLVVGFYLINVGFVTLALRSEVKPTETVTAIEIFSAKIGGVLMTLGAMHFFNLYVFSRIRRRGLLQHVPPPIAPRQHVAPAR